MKRRSFLASFAVFPFLGKVAKAESPQWQWDKSLSPEENLQKAQTIFESRYPRGPNGDNRISATGEEYVECCSGGVKGEFETTPMVGTTPKAAIEAWVYGIEKYAKDKRGTLYWRIVPEIDFYDYEYASGFPPSRYWKVYSRLLISDLPRIRPATIRS